MESDGDDRRSEKDRGGRKDSEEVVFVGFKNLLRGF